MEPGCARQGWGWADQDHIVAPSLPLLSFPAPSLRSVVSFCPRAGEGEAPPWPDSCFNSIQPDTVTNSKKLQTLPSLSRLGAPEGPASPALSTLFLLSSDSTPPLSLLRTCENTTHAPHNREQRCLSLRLVLSARRVGRGSSQATPLLP